MATLVLDKVWINRLDTGEAVAAWSQGRQQSHSDDGEVREYAGGRFRSITRVGEAGRFAFSLVQVAVTDVDTLRAWKGVAVAVRDNRGRRFLGVYYGIGIDESKSQPSVYNVSLDLRTITVDETI